MIAWQICVTAAADPPQMLFQEGHSADPKAATEPRKGYAIMRLPDGSFAFYNRYQPQSGPLTLPNRDGEPFTLLPALPTEIAANAIIIDSGVLNNQQVVLTAQHEVNNVFVKREDIALSDRARIGLPRYLNVWLQQASPTSVAEPKLIWRGYNGSQMEYQQLKSGRLIVPFGSFQPHGKVLPPIGRHKTVIQYSDDGGDTWSESETQLTSPCYPGFNGNNEGACEPAIEELTDGRIWMLMRTQAGFLYESTSSDDGTTWQPARASRFSTSTGPPNLMRHDNGWLVLSWNNCEMPPRVSGQGVYGGRDALHIAVSDDDGATWRGFREIYLDHRRNENPARSGDRGTAYPLGAYTATGMIVVLSGQGSVGRNPIVIDPQWIIAEHAESDFSDGLTQWSVYKHYGPAKNWWRARAVGCELVEHPSDSSQRCLRVGKPDELPADGATWNFPNGWAGSLTARVMLENGSHGGLIGLSDRMFDPANDEGDRLAVFQTSLTSDDRGGFALPSDQWHDVTLRWNLSNRECHVLVDGAPVGRLPIKQPTLNGISYVRFRSIASTQDTDGLLVDSVTVDIDDPFAPVCDETAQYEHEQRYVQQVVPTWQTSD